MIVDAHCHLQDERIGPLLPEALKRASDVGVKAFACCGTSESDWNHVLQLSQTHAPIHAALGLHPWTIGSRSTNWLVHLRALLLAHPEAGVGEIGLDHVLESADLDDQHAVFKQQLDLARELRRPVSIHCRRAWQVLLDSLDAVGPLEGGVMVHSFSGSIETMRELVGRGVSISLSGSITRHHSRRVRTLAAAVPEDNLLVETDAPDIVPYATHKGTGEWAPVSDGPNLPEYIVHVVSELATIRDCSGDTLAAATSRNAIRFFGLCPNAV